jgi:hypothetical protein
MLAKKQEEGKGTLLRLTRTLRAYLSLIEGPLTTFQIRTLLRENLLGMFVGKALARKLYKDAQLYNYYGTKKEVEHQEVFLMT